MVMRVGTFVLLVGTKCPDEIRAILCYACCGRLQLVSRDLRVHLMDSLTHTLGYHAGPVEGFIFWGSGGSDMLLLLGNGIVCDGWAVMEVRVRPWIGEENVVRGLNDVGWEDEGGEVR